MVSEQLQQKYMEMQIYNEHLKHLNQQVEKMEEQAMELAMTVNAVQEASLLKEGTEILVPVANGIFLRAKASGADSFLVGVGAGTMVKKSADETLELMQGQQIELVKMREKLTGQMEELIAKCHEIEESLEGDM